MFLANICSRLWLHVLHTNNLVAKLVVFYLKFVIIFLIVGGISAHDDLPLCLPPFDFLTPKVEKVDSPPQFEQFCGDTHTLTEKISGNEILMSKLAMVGKFNPGDCLNRV